MDQNYLMIRPIEQSERYLDNFTKNSIVAVGWPDVDFTKFQNVEEIFQHLPYLATILPQAAGRHKNQIRRFCAIKKGDRILVPYWDSVIFAIATGERKFNQAIFDLDQANEMCVNYLMQSDNKLIFVPREFLSEGLQRRIRVRGMTVSDLNEFSSEIERFIETGLNKGLSFSWAEGLEEQKREQVENFKKKLLENIQYGNTNLKAGGIGLEQLVLELAELEGYRSHILAKNSFPSFADADIEGTKADKFGERRILFQVKHHAGTSSNWGIEQLLEIKNCLPDLYENHSLVFVTSAGVDLEVVQRAEEAGIIIINGIELVDWLFELLPKISIETKMRLGILEIPQLIV